MDPTVNPYEMAYTRESSINGTTVYAQHADKNAAAVLFGIRTEQRHQSEYDRGRSMQLPGLKIESQQLMKHMAENLRREGFTALEPAPNHGVNVAPPVSATSHQESLRLPPLHSALSMPQLMPLQHQNYHNSYRSFSSPRNLPAPHVPPPSHALTSSSAKPYLSLPYQDSSHMLQQQYQPHGMSHAVQHPVHRADAKTMDPDETEDDHERTSATPAPRPCGRRTMCMFNGEKCRENVDSNDDENPRKVVSHIFGRNKTCTVHIPDECWVWWCRKHYQRCRYHTDHWALKQIEILFENLTKIEVWGGVENFTVALRKRENDRNGHVPSGDKVPASRRRAAGRPFKNKNRSIHTDNNNNNSSSSSSSNIGPVRLNAAGRPVRSPVNIASPVPDFLLKHVGCQRSFNEVREILHEIRRYALLEKEENNKEVAFPDIEILPNYTEATLRVQGVPSGQLSGNNHSRRRRARKPISSTRGRPHPYASHAVF